MADSTFADATPRDRPAPALAVSRRLRGIVRLSLTSLAALPIWLAGFPPLYDYYHWLFQGYVLAALLPGSPVARPELAELYYLRWVPVPNLATSLGIGLLSTVFDPAIAGRLFLLACVLGFGAGYAFLVRTIQRRPSVLEAFALPWAYGYMTYKGYLGSVAALSLAFVAIAYLHRCVADPGRSPGLAQRALLAALGVGCYLLHLTGWLVFVTAIGVYALWLWREGRLQDGRRLVETTLPTLALLGWYAWDRAGGVGLELYSSFLDKAISLYEGLLLFVRTDPVSAPFPLFWANAVLGALLFGVLVFNVDRHRRPAVPLVATGCLLTAIALLLPLYDLGDMGRPDERLLLPGLLLAIAGAGHRTLSARRLLAASGVIACVLGAHAFEYARASAFLERVEVAGEAVIPPGAKVANYTVWGSRAGGGCSAGETGSIGTPTMKWFGLGREIANRGTGSRLMETSVLHSRLGRYGSHELLVELVDPYEPLINVPRWVSMVELFGCADEVDAAASSLAGSFDVIERGPGFLLMKRPVR